MKNWYRTTRPSQSMRTISEIASACNVGFCRKIYCWTRTGV